MKSRKFWKLLKNGQNGLLQNGNRQKVLMIIDDAGIALHCCNCDGGEAF